MYRLKTVIKMKYIPDNLINTYLEFTPIDITASAIYKIIKFSNKENIVYHIFNHNHLYVKDILNILKSLNIEISLVENNIFKEKVDTILNSSKSNDISTLINDLDKNRNLNYDSKIKINSKHTQKLLKLYGFEWPKIDKKYIQNILKLIKGD